MKDQIRKTREKNTAYTNYLETDQFQLNGETCFSVLDFWRYYYGDLAGQSPFIAEYMVARSLGITKAENVTYWTAYDMSYRNMRIEVKATESVHAWNRKSVSQTRTFSIAPSNDRYWGKGKERTQSRQNDIYVFCLNTNQELQNPQPLNLDYWEFYIVPTFRINNYAASYGNPHQKKISLNVIRKMAEAVSYDGLKSAIDKAVDEVAEHRITENI